MDNRIWSALNVVLLSTSAFGAGAPPNHPTETPKTVTPRQGEFEYPELLVTPSASERLKTEAELETQGRWSRFLPLQVSALTTIGAGLVSLNDPGIEKAKEGDEGAKPMSYYAGVAGIAVGAGWLGITAALSATQMPYRTGMAGLGAVNDNSKRSKLARERYAEEHLMAPAALGRKLKWLSVVSNVAASGFIVAAAKDDTTKVAGGLAALSAFAPLIFSTRWETVGNLHDDYKKKIYGPVFGTSATTTRRLDDGAVLQTWILTAETVW